MNSERLRIQAPQILVVDDTPENLRLLVSLLTREGYLVRPAPNGNLGLSSARLKAPDLILLDIMMPDLNGFEVCMKLKQDETTRNIPVIFLTAVTDLEDKLQAFEVGGVDYITKPFREEEVLARVRAQLEIRELQRNLQEENARFRILEDATFEGILIHEDGVIRDLNRSLEKMLNSSRQDTIGRQFLDLISPAYHDSVRQKLDKEENVPYEIELLRQDGTSIPVEIRAKSFSYHGHMLQVAAVHNLSRRRRLEQENRALQITLEDRDRFGSLVGRSLAMQKVYKQLLQAALSDEPSIVYGETGTGKELAARTIFDLSEKHANVFVSVNCGAIQENLFESQFFGHLKGAFTGALRDTPGYLDQAQGGMLFLDEISELSLPMQTKLLRVLQEKEYVPVGGTTPKKAELRILAATNQELRELVRLKQFREDLFYRLHVLAINLPPLRFRKDDLPLLTAHFLKEHAETSGKTVSMLPEKLMNRFHEYSWPGNVRELRSEIQRWLTTDSVELQGSRFLEFSGEDDFLKLSSRKNFEEHVAELEQRLLQRALKQSEGNKAEAARILKLPLRTLHRKVKKYHL